MKNTKYLILAFIGGIIFTTLLSVSQSDANKRRTGGIHVNYTIPVKPSHTVYVVGIKNMNKYLIKGYQVQQTQGQYNDAVNVGFLMVKYK